MPGDQHGRFCGCAECSVLFSKPRPLALMTCDSKDCPVTAPAYSEAEGWSQMHGRRYCPTHSTRTP